METRGRAFGIVIALLIVAMFYFAGKLDPGHRAYRFDKGYEQITTISRRRIVCDRDTCTETCDTVPVRELWEAYDRCKQTREIRDTKLKTSLASPSRGFRAGGIGLFSTRTGYVSNERVVATE